MSNPLNFLPMVINQQSITLISAVIKSASHPGLPGRGSDLREQKIIEIWK